MNFTCLCSAEAMFHLACTLCLWLIGTLTVPWVLELIIKDPQSRPGATRPLGRALPVSVINLLLQFGFTAFACKCPAPNSFVPGLLSLPCTPGRRSPYLEACSTQIFHLLLLKQSWITCHWGYFCEMQHEAESHQSLFALFFHLFKSTLQGTTF